MSFKITFGTDGWRGVIAEDYTFDNVRRCAQGFANYLLEKGNAGQWVVVGHDKRFDSEFFAAAVAEVLAANGLKAYLTDGATPTPVIAFSVVNKKACGAVNITASHNPGTDNGFKVRNEFGGAIDPAGLLRIEALIPDSLESVKRKAYADALAAGEIVVFDPVTPYEAHLKELIDLQPIKDAGLTVMVDSMWGNGAGYFPRLLAGGKTKVIEIHNQRNPVFPEMKRPEPIPPNINVGLQATLDNHADVLLVTDGDADRVGVGDETGVGFKYVAPKMLETDALIGGEESGGYAFRGNVPERDGILAGLYMLDLMVRLGRKPTALLKLLFAKVGGEYFYDRIDRPFTGSHADRKKMILDANPRTIGGLKVVELVTVDGFQFKLEDGGWMLIRFSGTEPIMRVYCETMHADKVQAILQDGLKIAGLQ